MDNAENNTAIITFKQRLLPSRKQHVALNALLESQRHLYNGALEARIDAYRKATKSITLYTQTTELTELRRDPTFADIPVNLQRWTLRRLDDAYAGFFRRVKAGRIAGFPRFRGKGRWNSFGFAEFKGITLTNTRLRFKGLPGSLRVHLHRPIPEGKPLCCTFTRDHKGWFVCLQYRVPVRSLRVTDKQVGIDVGLTHLATLSTGEHIPNPRVAKRAMREMRRRQRAVSRCKMGSNRRKKVKAQVTRLHARIANARRTYLHQVSARLVRENDLIAVERLNVSGLAAGMFAAGVHDAAWVTLKQQLSYKAAWAGRELREVDPRHTSQACSVCGAIVPKKLSERRHCCPHCGLEMDRDYNAARNILHRAVLRPESPNVRLWPARATENIALDASSE